MDKQLTLLTADRGVIRCFAHGALKQSSRFAGRTELFSLASMDLYYSPVKDLYTLRESEVIDFFPGIRENGARFMAAGSWAELVIRSEALGEPEKLFKLLVQALRQLDSAGEYQTALLSIQFLLRTLAFGGLFPDTSNCLHCSKQMDPAEPIFLDAAGGGFLCGNCLNRPLPLMESSDRKYIEESLQFRLSEGRYGESSPENPVPLLELLTSLVREQLGVRIRSFEISIGGQLL